MTGKILLELVTGLLSETLQQLIGQSWAELLRLLVEKGIRSTCEEFAVIATDFNIAKEFMIGCLAVKLDWCRRFPYSLAGLAQHSLEAARRWAKQLLEEFDALVGILKSAQHILTRFFLDPGGPLRSTLEKFISGSSLDALPSLRFFISIFRFVNIVER